MLRFIDGFDHYATADLTRKWNVRTGTNNVISTATGRFGGNTFRVSQQSPANWISKTLPAGASWVVGFAFKAAASTGAGACPIVAFMDAGTLQVDVRLNADMSLSVTRNGTVLTGSPSTVALNTGVWAFIEFKVTVSDSIAAGSCKVRINGVDVLTVATGQDTKSTVNASANSVAIGAVAVGGGTATNWDFDDFYVLDSTGALNTDFLGDVRVETVFPTGSGVNSAWTPSTAPNWSCVDDPVPNDDTDYVSSTGVGAKDTYTMGDLSTIPDVIYGVQANILARKTDAGARSVAVAAHLLSGDYLGTNVALNTSYAYLSELSEVDPVTLARWISSRFNTTEWGVQLTV